jgi:hypothetical protein
MQKHLNIIQVSARASFIFSFLKGVEEEAEINKWKKKKLPIHKFIML